jgi:hypothetical protein
MKITFVVYHNVLEDKVAGLIEKHKIDAFTEWENVIGKFKGSEGHLGTRVHPGHRNVRMIPFLEDLELKEFIDDVRDVNKGVQRKQDEIRVFQLPLEAIV